MGDSLVMSRRLYYLGYRIEHTIVFFPQSGCIFMSFDALGDGQTLTGGQAKKTKKKT